SGEATYSEVPLPSTPVPQPLKNRPEPLISLRLNNSKHGETWGSAFCLMSQKIRPIHLRNRTLRNSPTEMIRPDPVAASHFDHSTGTFRRKSPCHNPSTHEVQRRTGRARRRDCTQGRRRSAR